jgi:BirA family biotin operon repressor/biotin-[acetyl-CoA-carboxylase] ligase
LVKNSMRVQDPLMPFDPALVTAHLPPGTVTWAIQWLPAVPSTQDLVREAAVAGAAEGWTVVADWQQRGRGRLGRQWITPPGRDLLFSVLLRPSRTLLSLLPLLAGVSLAEGLKRATGLPVDLKWPNDLLLGGRKLAGILLEHGSDQTAALGVGVNVNSGSRELPSQATSVSVGLGHPLRREPLLAAILGAVDRALLRTREEGEGWVVPAWRQNSSMLGQLISYEQERTVRQAVAEDVEDDGALRVRLEDGTLSRIYAGDVRLLRD